MVSPWYPCEGCLQEWHCITSPCKVLHEAAELLLQQVLLVITLISPFQGAVQAVHLAILRSMRLEPD